MAGDAHAEFALGKLYWSGNVLDLDRELAIQWIKRAADKGYKHAIKFLNSIERDGSS